MAGVNSEMDALPGIGHGCGHNLIAISGVGVALAVKAALQSHKIPGKVVLLGTPGNKFPVNDQKVSTYVGFTGEEGGGGKAILLDRGGYKEMDFCLMSDLPLPSASLTYRLVCRSHPAPMPPRTAAVGTSLAKQDITVKYLGHTCDTFYAAPSQSFHL